MRNTRLLTGGGGYVSQPVNIRALEMTITPPDVVTWQKADRDETPLSDHFERFSEVRYRRCSLIQTHYRLDAKLFWLH